MRTAARALRLATLGAACATAATVSALLVAVYAFPYHASQLAPERGGPLVITDLHGTVLRSVPAADGRPGRTNWVPLDEIPSHVLLTVVASEDEQFYQHRGVDGLGIVRAAWLDLRERRAGYGGSTITMQLARMTMHPHASRTVGAKISEAVVAMRMERAMSKRQILEQYLNRAYYGNGAYGIEAAAHTYFDKPARSLSPGEATLLAIVPRAPSAYDPLRHLATAVRRRDYVLGLLADGGLMTAAEVDRARAQTLTPALHLPPSRARHFTDYVLATLPPEVVRRGGVVRTTLDLPLEEALERRVADHLDAMQRRNLDQAGVVVLDTATGEILAMVGSGNYDGEDGQINIVTRRRHPGSALKPFVYGLAIENGESPASITYDVNDVPSAYHVLHPTQPEHGPVRYREALAGSYNLGAIHVLEKVGIGRMMTTLRRAGVAELDGTPDDYGLRLALGSAKVRLLDLAAGYGFLVRGGMVQQAGGVIDARAADGTTWRPSPRADRQIFDADTSWLVMDMLADGDARHKVFGNELPLDLPFPVAAKTGTSRGFADTVAIAATREVIVGAWAGNFDGEPTQGLVAMQSAAPLVRAALLLIADGGRLTLPEPPPDLETADVCPLSGLRAGPHCPHRIHEHFRPGTVPTRTCDWHRVHNGRLVVRYPDDVAAWARRMRQRGGRLANR